LKTSGLLARENAYGNHSGLNDLTIGVEALAILSQNNTPDEVPPCARVGVASE